jgi:hypothetical protein
MLNERMQPATLVNWIGTLWNVNRKIGVCGLLKDMVELVGLEPTTSSLRIMSPVSDAVGRKSTE